jgi:hypothetical protein
LELQLERSKAGTDAELRTKFFEDLRIPADLKETLAGMAADPALLRDMIADTSLLQDVGSDPDSFKDALNQGIYCLSSLVFKESPCYCMTCI